MAETCSPFDVLLDRDRDVYRAYGLERSVLRSWNPKTIWVYIKRWFKRGSFYDSHGDDTAQLGGDFIVDKHGDFKFVYPSHDPTDRPPVDDLLAVIKRLT